jgi:hypothetical protein
MSSLSTTEMQMLHDIRAKADDLARLIQEAGAAGFTIQFNINGQIGACDLFNVFRMVPVDLKMGAN